MKKITAILLVLLMLTVTVLVSCGESETESENLSEINNSSNESKNESQDDNNEYVIANKTFNNTKVVILGKPDGKHTFSRQQFEYNFELEGDPINEAVNDRNHWIKETYGIEITYLANPSDEYHIANTVIKEIETQENNFDAISDGLTVLAQLAVQGYLYDLSNLSDYLDLSKPWWDQRQIEALTINGKTMYAAGAALITDDEYTHCMLYNKDIMTRNNVYIEYGVESLYELVDNGDWTYDTMYEIAKMGKYQSGSGETMTKEDTLGVILDIGCLYYLMAGSGLNMAPIGEDGNPYVDIYNEFSSNVFSKLLNMTNDKTTFAYTERFFTGTTSYGDAEKQFGEGRAVFYMTKLSGLTTLINNAESDVVTGILPIPKYTSEQEGYYNPVAPLHFCCLAIPINNADNLDATCIALEALGYLGQEDLNSAYIERTLKIKRSDDTPDARMIDLILNNRSFDLAVVYNWGGMVNDSTDGMKSFFNKFAGSDLGDTFLSSYEAIKDIAESDLKNTLEAFK